MIGVTNEVPIYEIDGKDTYASNESRPCLIVKNHWLDSGRVLIVFEGKTLTVIASELRQAIANATNVTR